MRYTINDQIGQLGQSLLKLDETLSTYELRRKEMTQDLAHEIRNPLASIKSYLSAFEDGVWIPTPERLQACVEEINRLIILVGELDTLNDINSPTFKVSTQRTTNCKSNSRNLYSYCRVNYLRKKYSSNLELDQYDPCTSRCTSSESNSA